MRTPTIYQQGASAPCKTLQEDPFSSLLQKDFCIFAVVISYYTVGKGLKPLVETICRQVQV